MARLTSFFRLPGTTRPLRILFHVSVMTMLRHFEGVLLELARRGHTVRVASPEGRSDVPPPAVLREQERVQFVNAPPRRGDAWAERVYQLRSIRDYRRYLEPPFEAAVKLRHRAMRKMAKALSDDSEGHLKAWCPHCNTKITDEEFGQTILRVKDPFKSNIDALFALVEETIPSDARTEAFLRAESPDLLVVTPLVKIGSYQADYVKSGRALGIPVVFPVFSWDNLSTKGLIHVIPDLVLVWNERQRQEAIEMHGVQAADVMAVGAPRFDRFFAMQPQTTREQFCESHGFDPAQPIVAYLCSSEFVAGHEKDFVLRWIDEIRQAPPLRSCNVLIRPHPRQKGQWKKFATDKPRVRVAMPASINVDQTLFDSVYHSAAVVGLNTSAQLEAGIVGRPVLTMLAPEFSDGQQGTIHFHYLLKEHGGFVEMASDFDAHRQQLAAAAGGLYDSDRIRAFIRDFLRPLGIDRAVTPLMADTLEAFARDRDRLPTITTRV